jgi:adenine phosphoribosyltransferase
MKLHFSIDETDRRSNPPKLPDLSIVPVVGRTRGQLLSPLDGRNGAMHPEELQNAVGWLAGQCDLQSIDCVLGIPEGGYLPAYAFAAEAGLRVVFATVWKPAAVGVISFNEDHNRSILNGKHIVGLTAGQRVVIVEDEVTSGRTVFNCVRALRAAGVTCNQVVTIYAADDPEMRARFVAEGIRFRAVALYSPNPTSPLYRR